MCLAMREKAAWDITMNKLYENEVDIKRDLSDRYTYFNFMMQTGSIFYVGKTAFR